MDQVGGLEGMPWVSSAGRHRAGVHLALGTPTRSRERNGP